MTITNNPLSARSENQADYKVVKAADLGSAIQKQHEDEVIAKALVILESRMRTPGQTFATPDAVKAFLSLAIGGEPHEVFGVLFLDVHNRLLAFEEMFQGTLTQLSVTLLRKYFDWFQHFTATQSESRLWSRTPSCHS